MNNPLLFICGTRRSGTSVLRHLLEYDNYIVQFPLEQSVLKGYYSGRFKKFENYYENEFINDRKEGQQTILANQELQDKYNERLSGEFGYAMDLGIDCEVFKKEYLDYMKANALNIKTIHYGLFEALRKTHDEIKSRYDESSYLLYKKPESTEIFAQQCFKDAPDSKFIHIVRHPYDVYNSIKSRRTFHYRRAHNKPDSYNKIGSIENGVDFVTGFNEYSMASLHIGIENEMVIGKDNYKIILYEDLLSKPEEVMQGVAEFLNIPYSEELLIPTVMGKPHKSGSHFNKNTEVLQRKTEFKHEKFYATTSSNERNMINYNLSLSRFSDYYDDIDKPKGGKFFSWLRPYKNEAFRLHAWRLLNRKGMACGGKEKKRNSLNLRLTEKIKSPDWTNH